MEKEDKRFALLIDGENVSAKYIKGILEELSNEGVITYKRIYGDWTSANMQGWKDVLLENSVTPIQQYSYTTGKNATDSALIIDAMDILYSKNVDGFCLVSSDSDFTRLAARLRESGMTVIGMGEQKTPNSFIAACNRFKYLDLLYDAQASDDHIPSKAKSEYKNTSATFPTRNTPHTSLATIRRALRTIVSENSDTDDWMFIGTIGNLLCKRYPDFDARNFGFPKLTPFLKSLNMFEFRADGGEKGPQLIYIRLKEDECRAFSNHEYQ